MSRVFGPIRQLGYVVPDIEAAVCPDVDGLILTKMRGPDHVRLLDELVSEREQKAGLPEGRLYYDSFDYAPDVLAQILQARAGIHDA